MDTVEVAGICLLLQKEAKKGLGKTNSQSEVTNGTFHTLFHYLKWHPEKFLSSTFLLSYCYISLIGNYNEVVSSQPLLWVFCNQISISFTCCPLPTTVSWMSEGSTRLDASNKTLFVCGLPFEVMVSMAVSNCQQQLCCWRNWPNCSYLNFSLLSQEKFLVCRHP